MDIWGIHKYFDLKQHTPKNQLVREESTGKLEDTSRWIKTHIPKLIGYSENNAKGNL